MWYPGSGVVLDVSFPDLTLMCASNVDSEETVQLRSLIWTFAAHICDNYEHLIIWLKNVSNVCSVAQW